MTISSVSSLIFAKNSYMSFFRNLEASLTNVIRSEEIEMGREREK
jgi:hypothetical protein